jgi:hypothetical protein
MAVFPTVVQRTDPSPLVVSPSLLGLVLAAEKFWSLVSYSGQTYLVNKVKIYRFY